MDHIGDQIKKLSQKSGFKHREISEKIGVSVQQLYNIYGMEHIDTKHLVRFAQIFSVPVTSFFDKSAVALPDHDKNLIEKVTNDYLSVCGIVDDYTARLKAIDFMLREIVSNKNQTIEDVFSKLNKLLEIIPFFEARNLPFEDYSQLKSEIDLLREKIQSMRSQPESSHVSMGDKTLVVKEDSTVVMGDVQALKKQLSDAKTGEWVFLSNDEGEKK